MLSSYSYIMLHEGYYYYANPDDGTRLYRMDSDLQNPVKLSEHENVIANLEMQTYGDRLFYLQTVRTGQEWPPYKYTLCCYDLQSDTETVLSGKNILTYAIYNDWIYYQCISPAASCRMKLDGSGDEVLNDGYSDMFAGKDYQVYNDNIIYANNEAITKLNPNANEWTNFQGYSSALVVYRSSIFSISFNNPGALEKYDADAMEYSDKVCLVESGVESFCIIGDLLFYSHEDGMIYMMSVDGGKSVQIVEGSVPNASRDYLFYFDNDRELQSMPLNYDELLNRVR